MVCFLVKVIPCSSEQRVCGFYDQMLKVQLNGIPERGKLNAELIEFLAEVIDIPRAAIEIKKGLTSPIKTLQVDPAYAFKAEVFLSRYKTGAVIYR